MTDFEKTTISDLATIKETLSGIKDHLAKINGSVGRHEEAIAQLNLEHAKRERQCPLVDEVQQNIQSELRTIREYVISEKAKNSQMQKWLSIAKPAIWAALGSGVFLLGEHWNSLLKFWKG